MYTLILIWSPNKSFSGRNLVFFFIFRKFFLSQFKNAHLTITMKFYKIELTILGFLFTIFEPFLLFLFSRYLLDNLNIPKISFSCYTEGFYTMPYFVKSYLKCQDKKSQNFLSPDFWELLKGIFHRMNSSS